MAIKNKPRTDSVAWQVVGRDGKPLDSLDGVEENHFPSYSEARKMLNKLGTPLGAIFPVRS